VENLSKVHSKKNRPCKGCEFHAQKELSTKFIEKNKNSVQQTAINTRLVREDLTLQLKIIKKTENNINISKI